MGFPVVVFPEFILPKPILFTLSFIAFIRALFLRLLSLADSLPAVVSPGTAASDYRLPAPSSGTLIRQLLPVVKFGSHPAAATSGGCGGDGDAAESCAVCLYEFEGGEEIRWLSNCRHIFHRECLDRWIDHARDTCPMCRTRMIPEGTRDGFDQRLWEATGGASDPYSEYDSVLGL